MDNTDCPSPQMELITASKVVYKYPVWLISATLAGDGANGDAQLYDGLSTGGIERAHLEALSGTSFRLGLNYPVLFSRGLYAVVNASTSHLTLTYIPAIEDNPGKCPLRL